MKCFIEFDRDTSNIFPWKMRPDDIAPPERLPLTDEPEKYLRAAGAKDEEIPSALEAAQRTGRAEIEIRIRPRNWSAV